MNGRVCKETYCGVALEKNKSTFNASRKWKAASSKQPTECAYCPLSISIVLSLPWRIVGKRVNQSFICAKAYRKKMAFDNKGLAE